MHSILNALRGSGYAALPDEEATIGLSTSSPSSAARTGARRAPQNPSASTPIALQQLGSLSSPPRRASSVAESDANPRRLADELSARRVLPGTYRWRTAANKVIAATPDLIYTVACASLGTAAMYFVQKGMASDRDSPINADTAVGAPMGMAAMGVLPFALTNLKSFLDKVHKAISEDAYISPVQALAMNHEIFKACSAVEMKDKPEWVTGPWKSLTSLVDRLIADAKTQADKGVESVDTERIERLMRWNQDFIVCRPAGNHQVDGWKTEGGRTALEAELDRKLALADEKDKMFVKNLALRLAANSVELEGRSEPPARIQCIFEGAPGTGKDYAVYGALAGTLGIPVVEIDVPTKENGGFQELLPKTWDAVNQTQYATKDADLLGKIIAGLIRAQSENVIFYFNEVNARDPATIDGFKRLLDPEKKFIENIPLNTKFDTSRITFILSLNAGEGKNITDDPAIRSRIITHRFAPATEALVHKQALSAFNDSADSYRLPIRGGDGPVLSPERQKTLERSFREVLPTFVTEHRKADEGARVPFAGELTAHIATALRHGDEGLSLQQMTKLVVDHYDTETESKQKATTGVKP